MGTGKGKVTGPAWVGGQNCGNDCTAYYPRADNELRLKEAFWLAQVPLLQIDQHLQVTQLWPSQFNELTQYGVSPVGEFTHSLTIGEAEQVGILVYYGLTPPLAAGDYVPVWLLREALGQW